MPATTRQQRRSSSNLNNASTPARAGGGADSSTSMARVPPRAVGNLAQQMAMDNLAVRNRLPFYAELSMMKIKLQKNKETRRSI